MTLEETKTAIRRWIDSCTSEKQLSLCADAIDQFIYERFRRVVAKPDLDSVMDYLFLKITMKNIELNLKNMEYEIF